MAAIAVKQPEVSAESLGRIRRAIGRLSDPGDVAEIRRAAKREARVAESAGDDDRLAFCQAIVEETNKTSEAGRCIAEDQVQTTTAHPRPFRF